MVLVPILVFFFLKDREVLLNSIARLLPPQRPMMLQIWNEVNLQCANYVRGKAVEILIVGGATYIAFKLLGMPYAALLSLLVGLSVVIPYIGAAVVTIPVAVIALFAFGWGSQFIWVMVIYGVIQALDGNVLVPILFSEVNNLHPVAIIVAVLFFGGIWLAFRATSRGEPPELPPEPPDVAALQRWEAIRRDPTLDDMARAHALSQIFRTYVEAVLTFPATAWTTSEILERLRDMAHLPTGNVPRARRLLRATDRVKYAEARPGQDLLEELDADLRAFVGSTRPHSWNGEER